MSTDKDVADIVWLFSVERKELLQYSIISVFSGMWTLCDFLEKKEKTNTIVVCVYVMFEGR